MGRRNSVDRGRVSKPDSTARPYAYKKVGIVDSALLDSPLDEPTQTNMKVETPDNCSRDHGQVPAGGPGLGRGSTHSSADRPVVDSRGNLHYPLGYPSGPMHGHMGMPMGYPMGNNPMNNAPNLRMDTHMNVPIGPPMLAPPGVFMGGPGVIHGVPYMSGLSCRPYLRKASPVSVRTLVMFLRFKIR